MCSKPYIFFTKENMFKTFTLHFFFHQGKYVQNLTFFIDSLRGRGGQDVGNLTFFIARYVGGEDNMLKT